MQTLSLSRGAKSIEIPALATGLTSLIVNTAFNLQSTLLETIGGAGLGIGMIAYGYRKLFSGGKES